MDLRDPLSPRAVVRGILGAALAVAGLALVVVLLAERRVEGRLVALALTLWAAWSFFGSLFAGVFEPLGRFLGNAFTGGGMEEGGSAITIDQETALLERLLAADPPPPAHRAALAGIRLAEIYRTHEHDAAKADTLIRRLMERYPDAPELRYVRPR